MFSFARVNVGLIAALVVLCGVQTYRIHRLNEKAASITASVSLSSLDTGRTALSGEVVDDGAIADPDNPTASENGTDPTAEYARALEKREHEREGQNAEAGEEGAASRTKDSDKTSDKEAGKQEEREKKELKRQTQSLLNRAQEAAKQGDYANAIDMLNDCLEMDPSRGDAYRQLSQIYHKLGMTDKEMETYAQWMSNRPDDAMPHYQQAALYKSLGMEKEALDQLRQFQQMTQGNVDAYPMAASLYRKLGMKQEEGNALYAWANAAPGSVDARRSLAQYYARIGDKPSAAAEYQALVGLAPANADAHSALASVYRGMKQFPEAQAELVTAMNLQPQNMSYRLQLAQVYQGMGDRESAFQTYGGIIADAPGSNEAVQAQRAINRLARQVQAAQNKP
jgi:tetratricopeptide (TPR) repeat protein